MPFLVHLKVQKFSAISAGKNGQLNSGDTEIELPIPIRPLCSKNESLMLVKLTNISFVGLLHELLLFKQATETMVF